MSTDRDEMFAAGWGIVSDGSALGFLGGKPYFCPTCHVAVDGDYWRDHAATHTETA